MKTLFLLEFALFTLPSPSLAIVCCYWAAMSLVGGCATDGGAGMNTIVHIGTIMNDTGLTEYTGTVSK